MPEAPEPHVTFLENALAKARHASAVTGLPALADDSGLCVSALHDAPGVLSARFAAQAEERLDRNLRSALVSAVANCWLGLRLELLGFITQTGVVAPSSRRATSHASRSAGSTNVRGM